MHIVFLADPIDTQQAGIHAYCLNGLKAILDHNTKHQITIIKQTPKNFHPKAKIKAIKNPLNTAYNPIRKFWSIPNAIRKLNPDVVVEMAHFGPFNLPKNIKRVTVIHDLIPIKFPKTHYSKSNLAHRILLPRILKQATRIITPSKAVEQDLHELYPCTSGKTQAIYLGGEIPATDTLSDLPNFIPSEPYFFHAGTFEPRKNHRTLLQAYQHYRDQGGPVKKLLLAGEKGWKSNKIYKAIKNHPYRSEIINLGPLPQHKLIPLYSNAHAFIFPSLYEGFGLPLLEAMKCGAPCISAHNSSLIEVGGDGVLFFETEQSNDLAKKMRELDDAENRQQWKQRALEQSQKFSWEKHATEFLESLEKLLSS